MDRRHHDHHAHVSIRRHSLQTRRKWGRSIGGTMNRERRKAMSQHDVTHTCVTYEEKVQDQNNQGRFQQQHRKTIHEMDEGRHHDEREKASHRISEPHRSLACSRPSERGMTGCGQIFGVRPTTTAVGINLRLRGNILLIRQEAQ
jgi:hypothetical protein